MAKREFVDTYFENLALKELIQFACKKLGTDFIELGRQYILWKAEMKEKSKDTKKYEGIS